MKRTKRMIRSAESAESGVCVCEEESLDPPSSVVGSIELVRLDFSSLASFA